MRTRRLTSAMLSGSLSTLALTIAATAPAPAPVSAGDGPTHLAQGSQPPAGAKTETPAALAPRRPVASPYDASESPCAPSQHRPRRAPAPPKPPASPCAPSKS